MRIYTHAILGRNIISALTATALKPTTNCSSANTLQSHLAVS
jgi:hypothetical protein